MTSGSPVALSEDERRLVLALREIPESPLRDLYTRLVSELTDFVSSPTCAEMQGDGAPCTSAAASCDQCRKLETLLEGLRTRLHEG
jgi:hypothetical protein